MYKKILSTYIFFSPQDKRIIVRRAHESEYIVPYYRRPSTELLITCQQNSLTTNNILKIKSTYFTNTPPQSILRSLVYIALCDPVS